MNPGSIPGRASNLPCNEDFALRTALLALVIAAAPTVPSAQEAGRHVSAKDLAALVAKTTDGTAVAQVPTGPGAQMVAARREKTGEAEVHANFADQFIVQSGKATVLVGGKLEGGRETAPGEWRGGRIDGATRYELSTGDVLFIPAGVPHQTVVPSGGAFTYLVAKFPKPAS